MEKNFYEDTHLNQSVKCELCDKTLKYKNSLKLHHENFHAEKRYQCQYCDNQFTSKSSYQKHKRSIHENIKEYECSYCPRIFGRLWELKQHLTTKVHKDEVDGSKISNSANHE